MKFLISLCALLPQMLLGRAQESSNVPPITVEAANLAALSTSTKITISTVDQTRIWAEAVATKNGRSTLVGSDEELQTVICESSEVINLAGAFAMPGIGDSHTQSGLLDDHAHLLFTFGNIKRADGDRYPDALGDCVANYISHRTFCGFPARAHN